MVVDNANIAGAGVDADPAAVGFCNFHIGAMGRGAMVPEPGSKAAKSAPTLNPGNVGERVDEYVLGIHGLRNPTRNASAAEPVHLVKGALGDDPVVPHRDD